MPNWTSDQDAELTKLWADPVMSTTQIASAMGFASRNKVIGRAHRLGLEKRKPGNRRTFKHKGGEQTGLIQRIKNGTPLRVSPENARVLSGHGGGFSVKLNHAKSAAPKPPPPLNVADTDIPAAQRRTIFSLTNETCRWPIGDPGTPSFFFCGHASADVHGGQPYCAAHANRAFSGQGGRV
jgi:GcrA cell cycle regulator